MLIRPITLKDHSAILALAKSAGAGMTSLPADADVMQQKVALAEASFSGKPDVKSQEIFLFVLEDPMSGEVVGSTGIKAHVGKNQPFYSYKLTTITQQSRELGIFSEHKMLQVTNDLTGHSEIGSLFLLPHYRRDRLGRLLSLCRFLFIADYADYFAEYIIAEMRGMIMPKGDSPFYNSIARHFFEMDFAKADYINATQGNDFISDLMPKYPIYLSLLPKSAREAVGQPHHNSEAAKAMLEREGFRWTGYVDIFDGGPTLIADKMHLRTVKESKTLPIIQVVDEPLDTEKHLISNRRFDDFRCVAGRMEATPEGIIIEAKYADWLKAQVGDSLRFILNASRSA